MKTNRWVFIVVLAIGAVLVGWGSSHALFESSLNAPMFAGSILFNSPLPTPKPTRPPRPTRPPTPSAVPTSRPAPFRDEQGDLIAHEDVGVNPHGQIYVCTNKSQDDPRVKA